MTTEEADTEPVFQVANLGAELTDGAIVGLAALLLDVVETDEEEGPDDA